MSAPSRICLEAANSVERMKNQIFSGRLLTRSFPPARSNSTKALHVVVVGVVVCGELFFHPFVWNTEFSLALLFPLE